MREFIQIKYGDIYNEYCDFYNELDRKHPRSKDLTKSKTFKRWRRDVEQESEQETSEPDAAAVPIVNIKEVDVIPDAATDSESTSQQEAAEPDATAVPIVNIKEVDVIPDAATDSESTSQQEAAEPDATAVPIVNINEIDVIPDAAAVPILNINVGHLIDQIINELEQDDAARDILNQMDDNELLRPHYEDEDEGIGLNVETELEGIVEPFDYALEIEGFEEYDFDAF